MATENKNDEKNKRVAESAREQESSAKQENEQPSVEDQLNAAGVETNDAGVPTTSLDPVVAFANSAVASTGDVVEVPKTPKEIAKEGTKLGNDGDFSTGGIVEPVLGHIGGEANAPVYARVWAMDSDQTVANRHLPDSFKPDCSVRVS